MRVRFAEWALLFAYVVVIFLPPALHGYVYPNLGDDAAVHLEKFDRIAVDGMGVGVQYAGYRIVGFAVVWAAQLIGWSIDQVYLWFNYAMLAVAGVVIYFVVSRLLDRVAGLLAVLLVVFVSQGLMWQFYYGQLFNLMNMGIILPLAVYFVVLFFHHRRWWHLLLAMLFALLFGGFHASGIYLPVVACTSVVIYMVYSWGARKKIKWAAVGVGLMVVVASGVAFTFAVLVPSSKLVGGFNPSVLTRIGKGLGVPYDSYLLGIVSPQLLVLLVIICLSIKDALPKGGTKARVFSFLLLCMVLVLAVVVFGKLSLDTWRQALDLAIVLVLVTAVLLRRLLTKKHLVVVWVTIAVVGIGFYHNLPTWLGYTSAVRPVDKEAIAYVGEFATFSCSDTIAPWIYTRFTEAEWQRTGGDVVLMRSQPMTPRSDPENIWFEGHGWKPDETYELAQVFVDSEVLIEAYVRGD